MNPQPQPMIGGPVYGGPGFAQQPHMFGQPFPGQVPYSAPVPKPIDQAKIDADAAALRKATLLYFTDFTPSTGLLSVNMRS